MKPRRNLLLTAGLLAVSCSLGVAVPEAGAAPVKRALLIGVDDYLAPGVSDLRGCGNDVDLMKTILTGKFDFEPENVVVLKSGEATREAIIRTIRSHLVGPSEAGDIAILHYSGHGSQMLDTSGDEVDGLDETIVPHDSRQGGVFDINDDEINALMKEITEKTENVAFILDSCHSGSAARAAEVGNTVRQIPIDDRTPPPPADFTRDTRNLGEGPDDFRLPGAKYVLISGCRANELSNETRFEEVRHGALTFYLASALRSLGESVTYRDLMEQVKADVSARFAAQHPQVEGTGIDTVVFGDKEILQRPYVLIEPDPADTSQVTVQAGAVYGVIAESVLNVFPPGTKVFDEAEPIGRVRVTDVGDFSSRAVIESGAVEPHSRTVLTAIRPPNYRTGVFLADGETSELMQAIRAGLGEHDSVKVIPGAEDAQIRVTEVDGKIVLRGRDLESLSTIEPGPELADDAVSAITKWARWFGILEIDNAASELDFAFRIRRENAPASDPAPESAHQGDRLLIEVENRSGQDLHVVILDLASDGSITPLFPRGNITEAVAHGNTAKRLVEASVPAGRDVSIDQIKAIVTTEPISVDVFRQKPVARKAAPLADPEENALERFLRRSMAGLTRNLDPVDVDTWATQQRVLRVVRSEVETDGYAMHFDSEVDATRALELAQAGSRAVCGPQSTTGCLEVTPFEGDSTMVEVQTPAVRSGARSVQSVGQAFETAYKIRDETGALRVEPLLEQELQQAQTAPHPDDPATRGGGGQPPDPRAEGDTVWSHKYIRVPEAWADLRAARGVPAGQEASGVVIAHPDTGYLQHPEIWLPAAERPLWPEKGYDYYAEDDDPTDDRLGSRPLDNPVHGTGSSSAIISRAGCQLGSTEKCPTGVAQGARLVPLRINRSVVNFSQKKLAQALLDVSGTDRSRVKTDTDLAAIAMGGPPSWALWKAVQKAEERGYIIVAAAGNYVRKVIWPARFDSVIAVAAVNAGCKPWAHSSRGHSVDIAAPGQSVWRATVNQEDAFVTGMGTGTTYGTATTGGVAALWVAKHKGSPEYEALKASGQLAATLRRLMQETSWRPGESGAPAGANCDEDADWKEGKFGAGILDAAALLSAPLTDAAPRAIAAATVQELPLWSSLYPQGAAQPVRQSDYRQLFNLGSDADLESVAIYESEVLYHYAASESVATAIDEFVVSGNRSEAAYEAARQSLLAQDLSSRLRSALQEQ